MRTLLAIILLVAGTCRAYAAVYETKGHNAEIYQKDIEVLSKILKQNPCDLIALERMVKINFAMEDFREVIKYSGIYLSKNKNREISYLKIISHANLSEYTASIKNIEILLKDYNLAESEKLQLKNKLLLYKKYIQTASAPSVLKQLSWSKDRRVIGIVYKDNILAGYDNRNCQPFFYIIDDAKLTSVKQPDIFNDLNFSDLIFFSISPNGREILATISEGKDIASIVYRYYDRNTWSAWRKISIFSRGNINSYANFLPDGNGILFVSDRDTDDGLDIFIAERNSKGDWLKAEQLSGINTSQDESSVILHPDGETLYFSTNGREGKGGYDIFAAKLYKVKERYAAADIINIQEINTYRNEIHPLLYDIESKTAFFNFEVAEKSTIYFGNTELKPKPACFLNIFIYDAETKKPLEANIKIIGSGDRGSGTIYTAVTDQNGFTGFTIKKNKQYVLTVSSPGYRYMSENVQVDTGSSDQRKYFLNKGKIDKGYSFIADNIYFDTGSDEIKNESFPGLERLFDFLLKNPGIKVNIAGNTDNIGTFEFNMQLSNKRAESIAGYLIKRGIDKLRIETEGFGFLKSAATNITEEGRQKNRRVEITVIASE